MEKRITTPIMAQASPRLLENDHVQHLRVTIEVKGRENALVPRPHTGPEGQDLGTLNAEETYITDQEFDICARCQLQEALSAVKGLIAEMGPKP